MLNEGFLKLIITLARQLYCRAYSRLIKGRQYNCRPNRFYFNAFQDSLN